MKLTRRQKLLGACMLLSGLIFVLDRMGHIPDSAVAQPAPETVPFDAAASSAQGTSAATAAPAGRSGGAALPSRAVLEQLAARLCAGPRAADETLASLLPARDPFVRITESETHAPPGQPRGEASRTAAASQPAPEAPVEPFEKRHVLEGVIIGPTPMAWVDGHRVQIGSVVDGMVVVKICREAVTLRRGTDMVVLRLPPRSIRQR